MKMRAAYEYLDTTLVKKKGFNEYVPYRNMVARVHAAIRCVMQTDKHDDLGVALGLDGKLVSIVFRKRKNGQYVLSESERANAVEIINDALQLDNDDCYDLDELEAMAGFWIARAPKDPIL